MSEMIEFLNQRVQALELELQDLKQQREFQNEEIQKIMKAILDNHELSINITDKVNSAIIDRLKNLMSNE